MNILFLCVANSARSQLAEGLARSLMGESAKIESAGSEPSGVVQPWALKTLEEIGVDISSHRSKSVSELPADFMASLDYVVTLCHEEICPVLPTKAKRLHWPTPDPAAAAEGDKPAAFRRARDEIEKRIKQFMDSHNRKEGEQS